MHFAHSDRQKKKKKTYLTRCLAGGPALFWVEPEGVRSAQLRVDFEFRLRVFGSLFAASGGRLFWSPIHFLYRVHQGLTFFTFEFCPFCLCFLLFFTMSGRVACPCSLVVYFPAAVYKSVSTAEVLPKLLDALPVSRDDVLVVHFLRNGAVRVTSKSERACDTVSESGIRFGEYHLRIAPVEPKHVLVYLRDCPIEVPNKVASKVLEAFGEVHKITASAHEGFPSILNGTRVLKMSLHKDIPSVLRVGGFDCRVWYRRQLVLCSICGKAGSCLQGG